MELGQAAARTLLAGTRAVPPAALLPRFWSDQFGLRIQVCGRLDRPSRGRRDRAAPGPAGHRPGGVVASYRRGRLTPGWWRSTRRGSSHARPRDAGGGSGPPARVAARRHPEPAPLEPGRLREKGSPPMLRSVRVVLPPHCCWPHGAMAACAGLRDGPARSTSPHRHRSDRRRTSPPPRWSPQSAARPRELRAKKIAKMGEIVTDADGFVLYRFDKDTANRGQQLLRRLRRGLAAGAGRREPEADRAGRRSWSARSSGRTARRRSPWPAGRSTATWATRRPGSGRARPSGRVVRRRADRQEEPDLPAHGAPGAGAPAGHGRVPGCGSARLAAAPPAASPTPDETYTY